MGKKKSSGDRAPNHTRRMPTLESCSICLESLTKPGLGRQTLSCGHTFHEQCLAKLSKSGTPEKKGATFHDGKFVLEVGHSLGVSNACPLCRKIDPQLLSAEQLLEQALILRSTGDKGDLVRAFLLVSRAYDIDPTNELVSCCLGGCFEYGCGTAQNYERAFEIFEKLHMNGCRTATVKLGVYYAEGIGVKQDLEKARDFMNIAKKAGDPTSNLIAQAISRVSLGLPPASASAFLVNDEHGNTVLVTPSTGECSAASAIPGDCSQFETNTMSPRCGSCNVKSKKFRCSRCKRIFYCSRNCQKSDWPSHKSMCNLLNEPMPIVKSLSESGVLRTSSKVEVEEQLRQMTLDQSLNEADPQASNTNARIATSLIHDKDCDAQEEIVVVLKFSRNPSPLHVSLQTSIVLNECRRALEKRGFNWRLKSGAYAFVEPSQYEALMTLLDDEDIKLGSAHVVVSTNYEDTVMGLVKSISRSCKICTQTRSELSLDASFVSTNSQVPITVTRTFIHMKIPSSLRSAPTGNQTTVSTTDASARNGLNPRKA